MQVRTPLAEARQSRGDARQQLLEVVEQQQHSLLVDVVGKAVLRTHRPADLRLDDLRVGDRRERNPQDPVVELADGVLWVPLAAITDPEIVEPEIGRTVGAQNGLADHIDEKRMLLLLDNLEQLLPDVASRLARLGDRCPNLHLLLTSRAALRIAAEREYAVDPLPETDAVALFQERAFVGEPEDAVHEICRRLDGLPLAIELAAARTRVLAPDRLLERLGRALPVLTGGRRDAPERQRTLRATIEWSYELLPQEERRLFARLAVFAGSFTAESADAVFGASLDLIEALVEHSLVRRWETGRLGMLETLGQGPQRDDLVLPEQHNLRAALDWTVGSDPELGLELAVAVENFWVTQ